MRSDREKTYDLGVTAKALIELHLEKPKRFDSEAVLRHLFDKYKQLELDPIEPCKATTEEDRSR